MPDTSGTNYSFLNDYISKIIGDSDKVDNTVSEEDDDHFYDVPDEDDTSDENNDIQYSMNSNEDDNSDEGARLANDYLHETGDPDTTDSDYDTEDETDSDQDSMYGQGDTGSVYDNAPSNPDYSYVSRNEDPANSELGSKIASKESQGKYAAFNSAGGGAGAVGKYQFRWNIWKDSIQKVTGVKSKDEFLNNPQAQEKYYGWYEKNYLIPVARKLQPYNKKGLSEDQVAELVHFRGEDGAKKWLQGTASDKPERYNIPTSKYITTKQTGGEAEHMDSVLQANKNVPFVDRLLNPDKYPIRKNPDGTVSTMIMSSASDDKGPFAYPSLRLVNGKWVETKGYAGAKVAKKAGDIIRFKTDAEADNFASNGYKKANSVKRMMELADEASAENMKNLQKRPMGGGGGRGGGGGHVGGGGMGVAMSSSAQHIGLNNSSFDHMLFPMHGENEFRGLDDGSEIYLEDEYGKKKKLKGKHHKTKMKGHVFETRLNR